MTTLDKFAGFMQDYLNVMERIYYEMQKTPDQQEFNPAELLGDLIDGTKDLIEKARKP